MTTLKAKTVTPKFQPGDRVAERPKASAIPNLKQESLAKTAQYRSQRYGVVVDTFTKTIKGRTNRESRQIYVKVLWDGMQSPSNHAQMRLVHEKEFPEVMDSYIGGLG